MVLRQGNLIQLRIKNYELNPIMNFELVLVR